MKEFEIFRIVLIKSSGILKFQKTPRYLFQHSQTLKRISINVLGIRTERQTHFTSSQ
jgi:hypothetical protein